MNSRISHILLHSLVVLLSFFQEAPKYPIEVECTRAYLREHPEFRAGSKTPDGSFVDLETDARAYEVDWASKWKEGIGQALFYAAATGKKPGLILLMKKDSDVKFYLRALVVCSQYGIELRTYYPKPVEEK